MYIISEELTLLDLFNHPSEKVVYCKREKNIAPLPPLEQNLSFRVDFFSKRRLVTKRADRTLLKLSFLLKPTNSLNKNRS